MQRELNPALVPSAYVGLPHDPFVAWLASHGLLRPGCAWTAETDTHGYVFRRRNDFGKGWPTDHIAGPLVVRPKRRLEMV